MSEIIKDRKVYSLLEVTQSIKKALDEKNQSCFWVKAEMNKLNHYIHSGHCYPDLVEKQKGKVVAQMRANLWRSDYLRINRQFLRITKEPIRDNISILCFAKVTFDPVHGLALQIRDIDPVFTLGELEREKQETIDKLKQQAVFDNNRNLQMPMLPQRIAVISVESSKGYADFLSVIENNQWGYRFFQMLFPSLLQGDNAVHDMIRQLNRIERVKKHFDVVAIIRGGGGDVGLSCFNHYELARKIATFPLPVLTGIGHSTNQTVVEMLAHSNNITPTKLAEFLIQEFHNFSVPVKEGQRTISEKARELLSDSKTSLNDQLRYFKSVTGKILEIHKSVFANSIVSLKHACIVRMGKHENKLEQLKRSLLIHSKGSIIHSRNRLESMQSKVELLSPENVLKRGYSITTLNGYALKNTSEVQAGDEVETRLFEGKLKSIVKSTSKK
ncbi:MAG: exodeoxyribonuclease VII large subunit [Bacteroidota bacterium]